MNCEYYYCDRNRKRLGLKLVYKSRGDRNANTSLVLNIHTASIFGLSARISKYEDWNLCSIIVITICSLFLLFLV